MSAKTYISCDEFEQIAHTLGPCELIDGELIQLPYNTMKHSFVSTNINCTFSNFVHETKTGWVCLNLGIRIREDPPLSRGADVAFISFRRLPQENRSDEFLRIAPELIVEVLRDDETWTGMKRKVSDFLEFGTGMVWVVDPSTRTVKTFPQCGKPSIVHDGEQIEGGKILPGFKVPVARFFDGLSYQMRSQQR